MNSRRKSIGASEIAAVCGVCPFSTPRDVWRLKLGFATFEGNAETLRGQALESGVRKMLAAHLGVRIYNWNKRCVSSQRPYASCTPDGYIEAQGGRIGVELKTYAGFYTPDTIADRHLPAIMQCNWSMYVTGLRSWILGWMDSSLAIQCIDVEYNAELVDLMLQAADYFWKVNVLQRIEPDAQAPHDFEPIAGSSLIAAPSTADLVDQYRAMGAEISRLTEERSALGNQIKMIMGVHESMTFGGRTIATWKLNKAGTGVLLTKTT